LPILIGSGITPENVNEFSNADGFIVGSYLKENGLWSAEMDEKRVEKMIQAVQK
jgi:predicted TIM-barrel enzyme